MKQSRAQGLTSAIAVCIVCFAEVASVKIGSSTYLSSHLVEDPSSLELLIVGFRRNFALTETLFGSHPVDRSGSS